MNKSLFNARMKSIEHYKNQIKDLEETIRQNEDVLKDLILSLKEFFPFEVGDILIKDSDIVLISSIDESCESYIKISVKLPNGKGDWELPSFYSYRERKIPYPDFDLWKKIGSQTDYITPSIEG